MADNLKRINEIKAQIKALRKELEIAEEEAGFRPKKLQYPQNVSDERIVDLVEVYQNLLNDCHWRNDPVRGCSRYFNLSESTIRLFMKEAKRRNLFVEAKRG